MFTIRQATGKGLGVFAVRPIAQGQRILADKALLSIAASDAGTTILQQAHALSTASRKTLLDLSINSTQSTFLSWIESIWRSKSTPTLIKLNHTILNIFRNNNFNIGNDIRSLFPQVARLNHACVPNSQGNFNNSIDAFTIHATRNIEPDEEITISYLDDQFAQRHTRQTALLQGYGFSCTCPACMKGSMMEVGESRRAEMKRRLELFAANSTNGPAEEFEMIMELLEAYESQDIRGREVATMSIAAARKAQELGEVDVARELALKGLQLEKDSVGTDNPFYKDTQKIVKELGVVV